MDSLLGLFCTKFNLGTIEAAQGAGPSHQSRIIPVGLSLYSDGNASKFQPNREFH